VKREDGDEEAKVAKSKADDGAQDLQ
jgi:hypothetical protein